MGGKKQGLLKRLQAWMVDYAYLVTLGCMIAIVACSAAYTMQLRREQETGIQAAADAMEIAASPSPAASPQVTPLPTIAPLQVRTAALAPDTAWPLMGSVLRAYDAQELVYWEKLGCWQAHTGMDIAGEAGETVRACADGEVVLCVWDELWGWRMAVKQEDGREMLYAGLESCLMGAGMRVRRGEIIGTLLEEIPCEGEWGAHLHLEMRLDGCTADPEAVLPER